MRIVVSYDITDDRRRTRFAKRLRDHLTRVQFSVFEGDVAPAEVDRIERIIQEELRLEEDSVRIYFLCRSCHLRTRLFGTSLLVGPLGDEVL